LQEFILYYLATSLVSMMMMFTHQFLAPLEVLQILNFTLSIMVD